MTDYSMSEKIAPFAIGVGLLLFSAGVGVEASDDDSGQTIFQWFRARDRA